MQLSHHLLVVRFLTSSLLRWVVPRWSRASLNSRWLCKEQPIVVFSNRVVYLALGRSSTWHSSRIKSHNQALSAMWELVFAIKTGPEFYWGIKGNELCVLCAPSVYLISMWGFFLLWLNMDRGKLITLQNGGMKCLLALPGGWTVFALPECVRAAVGTTGQSWALHHRWCTVWVHSTPLWRTGALEWAAVELRQKAIEFKGSPSSCLSPHISTRFVQNKILYNSYFVTQTSFPSSNPVFYSWGNAWICCNT